MRTSTLKLLNYYYCGPGHTCICAMIVLRGQGRQPVRMAYHLNYTFEWSVHCNAKQFYIVYCHRDGGEPTPHHPSSGLAYQHG